MQKVRRTKYDRYKIGPGLEAAFVDRRSLASELQAVLKGLRNVSKLIKSAEYIRARNTLSNTASQYRGIRTKLGPVERTHRRGGFVLRQLDRTLNIKHVFFQFSQGVPHNTSDMRELRSRMAGLKKLVREAITIVKGD